VTVHQCTVCERGTCAVCNAPRRREAAPFSLPLEAPRSSHIHQRRGGGEAERHRLEARQNPEPGLECRSSLQPPSVDDCKGLADTLRGKTLRLPYVASHEDCDLAVFAHFRDFDVRGDQVADRIAHDADVCKSAGSDPVVGFQIDTSQEVPLFGFTIWFGNLCSMFSFGTANCVP
jgi:hypothetical protein